MDSETVSKSHSPRGARDERWDEGKFNQTSPPVNVFLDSFLARSYSKGETLAQAVTP